MHQFFFFFFSFSFFVFAFILRYSAILLYAVLRVIQSFWELILFVFSLLPLSFSLFLFPLTSSFSIYVSYLSPDSDFVSLNQLQILSSPLSFFLSSLASLGLKYTYIHIYIYIYIYVVTIYDLTALDLDVHTLIFVFFFSYTYFVFLYSYSFFSTQYHFFCFNNTQVASPAVSHPLRPSCCDFRENIQAITGSRPRTQTQSARFLFISCFKRMRIVCETLEGSKSKTLSIGTG